MNEAYRHERLKITPEEDLAEYKIRLQERRRVMKWLVQFEKPSLYVDTRTFRIPKDELERMILQLNQQIIERES